MSAWRGIEERVERLERLEAARNAVISYADAVDASDPEAIAAVFLEDGVLSIPAGDFVGRQSIIDFYEPRVTDAQRRHFIMNVRAQHRDDGDVDVRCYYLFTGREPDGSAIGWGVYDDVIRVECGEASFVRKRISPLVATTIDLGWPK